jgi:hypothetical protein
MTKPGSTMTLYANLMQEVKVRLEAINVGLTGQTNLPSPIARETCYLQLRMICELIALGCLVAHGDISAIKLEKFRKEWSAEKIINALSALHPDFYPRPVIQKKSEELGVNWHFDSVASGFLTKAELLELYGKCGDILHRGRLKNLLKPQSPVQSKPPPGAAFLDRRDLPSVGCL